MHLKYLCVCLERNVGDKENVDAVYSIQSCVEN